MQDAQSIKDKLSTDSIKDETIKEVKNLSTEVKVKPDLKVDEPKPLTDAKPKEKKQELSREINVDDTLKDDADKKVKITFKGKDFIKKEISKKTADAPLEEQSNEIKVNTPKELGSVSETTEQIREKLIQAEETQVNNFTPDDYEMIAEFLIDTLDWGGSSALMYVAKDKTDSPYTLSVAKKERLKKQLTRILIKSNFKMNFGVLFAFSLVLAYMKPLKAALENRKVIVKGEVEQKRKEAEEQRLKRQKEIEDAKKQEIKIESKPKKEKPKKDVIIEEATPKQKEEPKKQKPTPDTKVNDITGAIEIDREKGNPTTPRRRRRRG